MNELLKRLLQRGRYMAPEGEDQHMGGSDDDLDDEDLDEDSEPSKSSTKSEVKIGDQDDGSVILELEDEDAPAQQNGDGDAGEKGTSQEGEDDEAAREKIRADRREERKARKERQREKEEASRRELAAERSARQALEQRLAALEGRDRTREIAGVETNIRRTEDIYDQARIAYQEAIEQHDGEAAAKAQETMLVAREKHSQLITAKKAYEQQQKGPQSAADPVVVNYAQKFLGEHSWYKHGGEDIDSRIMKQIDDSLASEGKYSPTQSEYWDELRTRVKKYLPHRVASGKVNTTDGKDKQDTKPVVHNRQQKAVVGGGGGESQGAGKGTYHLSADRVKAIKDAGMWDDPKKRQEMITYYRNFDKQNSKGN